MGTMSRRWLRTAVVVATAGGAGLWLSCSPDRGPSPDSAEETRTGQAIEEVDSASADGGPDHDLAGVDLGEDVDLSAEFEPPATRQVQRWELLRDGRSVGGFRAEVARGQEGMIELRFQVRSDAGTDRGSVTTVSRLFYRYARLAVQSESASPLPLLTVLAPPALEAVLATLEGRPAGGPEGEAGEEVTVDGTAGRRFTRTVGDGIRIETVAVPGRLLPLRVRTTLADGTVLEARPPAGSG